MKEEEKRRSRNERRGKRAPQGKTPGEGAERPVSRGTTPDAGQGGRIPQGATPASAGSRASCEEMSRLYSAHEMSLAEASIFEAHFAGCKACKELIAEWKELFSVLSSPAYDAARPEPSSNFDRPIMGFVQDLIGERERAARAEATVRRRATWAGIAAVAAVLAIFSDMLSRLTVAGVEPERPYVIAITWIVGAFHKGFDWLIFSFMRGIKIGEVFIQIFEKLQPIWNGLGAAARQLDPQLVVMEVLLFMLSLVLLKGFLGTAPKGRCTNVGIII